MMPNPLDLFAGLLKGDLIVQKIMRSWHRLIHNPTSTFFLQQESEILLDRLIAQGWQPSNPVWSTHITFDPESIFGGSAPAHH
jgi:hypothetical protein